MGEGGVWVAKAVENGELGLGPEPLDARQVVVQAELVVERQGRRDHRPGGHWPDGMQRRGGERHDGAQAVIAAGELEYEQGVVVVCCLRLWRGEGARNGFVDG